MVNIISLVIRMVFLEFANIVDLLIGLSNKILKLINEIDGYVFRIRVASLMQAAYYLSGSNIEP